jgi:alkylated DNA repair protein alkB family protein 6
LDVLPKPESSIEQEQDVRIAEKIVGKGENGKSDGPPTKEVVGKADSVHLPTRIFQEPRSLLVTTGRAYRQVMHGIASIEVDEGLNQGTVANWGLLSGEGRARVEGEGGRNVRGTRVSLTYRDVIKVSKAANRVLGVGRR